MSIVTAKGPAIVPALPQQRIAAPNARRPLFRRTSRRAVDPKVAMLASLGLFADVPERTLMSITSLLEHLDLPAGMRLLTEGTVAGEAFVLVDGVAQAQRRGRVLGQAHAGELLGDLAFLRGGFAPLTWTAVTNVTVLSFTPRELHEVVRRCPVVADRLRGCTPVPPNRRALARHER